MSGATKTASPGTSPTVVLLTNDEVAGITSDVTARVTVRGKVTSSPLIRKVKLASGRILFKCPMCNYANTKPTSITPHLKIHPPKDRAVALEALIAGLPVKQTPRKTVAAIKKTTAKKVAAERKVIRKRVTQPTTTITAPEPQLDGDAVLASALDSFIESRNETIATLTSERDLALARVAVLESTVRQIHDTTHVVVNH
jgi:hypothetical protein